MITTNLIHGKYSFELKTNQVFKSRVTIILNDVTKMQIYKIGNKTQE